MSDIRRRPAAVGSLDEAAFDAALEHAAEQVLAAAHDDTAGARVVARLLAEPRHVRGRLLWVPAAAFALLVLAVSQPLRESASTADRSTPVGPVIAAASAPGADRPATSEPRGASVPPAETPMTFVAAASGAALPGARRRARVRTVGPAAFDDAWAVPLLVVTSELRLGIAGGADASGSVPAPAPLPVDALVLELLEPEALDLRPTDQ